jgi:hypothetical protein
MTPEQAIILIEALFEWEDLGEQASRRRNPHIIIAMKAVNPHLADDKLAYGSYRPVFHTRVSMDEKYIREREKLGDFLWDWSRALRMSYPSILERPREEEKK